ncbi:hypothetical protein L6164_035431 [Bauhinia variegata]|uniref:Uncharacterized protein n=1 Tax=Bauhinia variegata TaxID=167791 RepID=A0ACB9KE08_BAUVA|nr:hypothetical protein L6164_035431 [Bauhinia variegata]
MSCVTAQTNFSPYTNIINNMKPHLHPKCQALALPPISRSYSLHTLLFYTNNPLRVLLLARGTAVPKPFIVPLFALQAPASIVAWTKGRYGVWTAFLALLVRLFFFLPGELELAFVALLLLIVAPSDVGEHNKAFDQGITRWSLKSSKMKGRINFDAGLETTNMELLTLPTWSFTKTAGRLRELQRIS